MARAIEIAGRGRGFTSPNPVVGAVLVRGGQVVGEGHHERFGGAHAEVRALEAAGDRARGATLYVTLEPCCVWGKTPPCTEAIISAGIARAVVATEDPNPAVSGRGIQALRDANLVVETGVLQDHALALNAPYFKFREIGLPHVLLKMALSIDGRVVGPDARERWMTSEASREIVHAMRGDCDCVMVGIGTVLADDPELSDRRRGARPRQPVRLAVDRRLRIPGSSTLARSATELRTVVACGTEASPERAGELESQGVRIWRCPGDEWGLDLSAVLARAALEGMLSVLSEGGPRIAASLLRAGLVDRVAIFVAPTLLGSEGLPAFGALGDTRWRDGWLFRDPTWRVVGRDVLFEAAIDRADGAAREGPRAAPAVAEGDGKGVERCSQGSSRRRDGSTG